MIKIRRNKNSLKKNLVTQKDKLKTKNKLVFIVAMTKR